MMIVFHIGTRPNDFSSDNSIVVTYHGLGGAQLHQDVVRRQAHSDPACHLRGIESAPKARSFWCP